MLTLKITSDLMLSLNSMLVVRIFDPLQLIETMEPLWLMSVFGGMDAGVDEELWKKNNFKSIFRHPVSFLRRKMRVC